MVTPGRVWDLPASGSLWSCSGIAGTQGSVCKSTTVAGTVRMAGEEDKGKGQGNKFPFLLQLLFVNIDFCS